VRTRSFEEKREARRRPILESFALFVVVPGKGAHRLPVFDLSEKGIGFQFDHESESPESTSLNTGEAIELCLYLNQSLYIALQVRVARIHQQKPDGPRIVGASFADSPAGSNLAAERFVQLLDALAEIKQK
jgi:hypothetical protein